MESGPSSLKAVGEVVGRPKGLSEMDIVKGRGRAGFDCGAHDRYAECDVYVYYRD